MCLCGEENFCTILSRFIIAVSLILYELGQGGAYCTHTLRLFVCFNMPFVLFLLILLLGKHLLQCLLPTYIFLKLIFAMSLR
jgi:hypothetical protein